MAKLKKISAAFIAFIMIISMVGCGDTSWAVKIDGYEVRAGIYIYFSYDAYTQALEKIKAEGVDTEDKKAVKKAMVENVPILEWVQNEATKQLSKFVAVEREFDKLELSLSEDELKEIKQNVSSFMDANGEKFEENGVGEQSIKDIITSSYKGEAVFKKYYEIGGLNSVTEKQLKDYYLENSARVKYIQMSLMDGSGNLLEGDEKEKRIEMAEGYLQRLKDGEDIDDLLIEYSEFSAALVSEAAAATATDVNGETLAPTTTVTTTSVTTVEETETTEVEGGTDEDLNSETLEDEETSVTTSEEEEDTDISLVETTTTNPYLNEVIIQKITTPVSVEKDESEETTTVNYRPSKKSNEAIFGSAVIGKPFLVEEDDACYIILKLDIEERMNDDDLWSEQAKDSLTSYLYYEEFDEMIVSWADKFEIDRNDEAYKRYNPHKYDFEPVQ